MTSRDLLTITPEIAQEFLNKNHCGRNLDRKLVDQYAARMRDGTWQKHPENQMARDEDGNLQDGQHRNTAIVETGVTLKDVPMITMSDEDRNR